MTAKTNRREGAPRGASPQPDPLTDYLPRHRATRDDGVSVVDRREPPPLKVYDALVEEFARAKQPGFWSQIAGYLGFQTSHEVLPRG